MKTENVLLAGGFAKDCTCLSRKGFLPYPSSTLVADWLWIVHFKAIQWEYLCSSPDTVCSELPEPGLEGGRATRPLCLKSTVLSLACCHSSYKVTPKTVITEAGLKKWKWNKPSQNKRFLWKLYNQLSLLREDASVTFGQTRIRTTQETVVLMGQP